MSSKSEYSNIAFISYKREDEAWAKWLQKKIEHYKLPIEIRKIHPNLEFSERPRHVFKDTTDLSGGVLAKAIKAGLDSSKFLIVICSPRAAKSEWVCKEVQEFIDSGREEYIIPFIIEGEPHAKNKENECFPSTLKSLAGERELLGININENGREAAIVKVVARMFGLSFDSLWQRFKREEKQRKRSIITAFILAIIVLLSIIAYGAWMNHRISSERDRTNIANKQLFSANQRINKQKDELQKANDSITKQKTDLQVAFDKLSKTESALFKSNMDLAKSNNKLQKEKQNVLKANKNILIQRSIEYGNLAYNYIEDGKIPEAEELLHKIIPDDEDQYVYTPQMERALRRYYNYKNCVGIKLVENKELLGSYVNDFPLYLSKYGFPKTKTTCDKIYLPSNIIATVVFNQKEDTLLVINDGFENTILSKDGNLLLGYKNDSIYIWNICEKHCLCQEFLYDGIYDVKFLNNNRICVLGEKHFTIYKFNSSSLELESKTKILNRPKIWKNKYGNIPFLCDDKDKRLIYQQEDSCLIVQQIGTNNKIVEKKIDGVIESIALLQKDYPALAFTYKNENQDLYEHNSNRLEILHYPSFFLLYKKRFDGYIDKLEFSTSNYLGALVKPHKEGITQLYLWDMSKPIKWKSEYSNLPQTVTINKAYMFENIKFITNDGCIVYLKKSKETNLYTLFLLDLISNTTYVLLESEYSYEIDAKSSLDGNYIVYYKWNGGVWLYDRKKREKKKISSNDFSAFRNISISPDGSKIAFRAYKSIGMSNIVIYDVNNQKIKQYTLKSGFGMALNCNGSKLLLEDVNTILYDYNLNTLKSEKISSPVGSRITNTFGYSKNGEYIYQIYCKENYNDEYVKNYYIKIWTSDKHELIMENLIDYSNQLFIDADKEYIYRTSNCESEIIPFKKIDFLIQFFKNN